MSLDTGKLAMILGLLGSDQLGERAAAAAKAHAMIKAASLTWDEVLAGGPDLAATRDGLAVATQACEFLQARVSELEKQLPDWQSVTAVPIGNHNCTGKWLIGLNDSQAIFLTRKERSFVEGCAKWFGPQSSGQRDWLQSIVNNVCKRTGLRPPP